MLPVEEAKFQSKLLSGFQPDIRGRCVHCKKKCLTMSGKKYTCGGCAVGKKKKEDKK